MTQTNRLSKLVKATSKFPKGIRSTLWSKAFGRVVPMVGTANIKYLEVSHSKVVVEIKNHRAMHNHIGQLHAVAMALIAETATGFVTGDMTATATLSKEQILEMQSSEKGETLVPVTIMDESGKEPVECQMAEQNSLQVLKLKKLHVLQVWTMYFYLSLLVKSQKLMSEALPTALTSFQNQYSCFVVQLKADGLNIVTELSPAPTFHPAEEYHQNFFARNPAQGGDAITSAVVFGKVNGIDGLATVAVTKKMIINTNIISISGMRFISFMPESLSSPN
ncbi:unnamed protein product [Oppiella nova]|uniref:peptide-methionine (S)-S-oxide reductase n=1 Tax=Oppiella nova TaxID=334625 RepID=A0A7R9L768_9ACAR|nr:unnamed protein product [Oppiella nova]CAG2155696.1 unnamed protein product [Oppiella nova]